MKALKSEITKLKKDLDEARSASQQLKDELLKRQTETDLLAKAREELAAIKSDRDRLQEAMKVGDDDVAWLRSHVAQLTQQLALPTSQEEAKAKHWCSSGGGDKTKRANHYFPYSLYAKKW